MFDNRIVLSMFIVSLCVLGGVSCSDSVEGAHNVTDNPLVGVWYLLAVGNSEPKNENFSCARFNVTNPDGDNFFNIDFTIKTNGKSHRTKDRLKVVGSKVYFEVPRDGMSDLVLDMEKYNKNTDLIFSYNSMSKRFVELVSRKFRASAEARLAFGGYVKSSKLHVTKIDHDGCSYN